MNKMLQVEQSSDNESVFENLIFSLKETVRDFRLNVFLIISILSVLGFLYGIYKNLALNFNLADMIIVSYMFMNFLVASIFCIYYKIQRKNFKEKTFNKLCYICLTPYLLLYYLIPFTSTNSLVGVYNFFVSFAPLMLIILTLGQKKGLIVGGFYLFLFFTYFFLKIELFSFFDNSFEFGIPKGSLLFLTNSFIWSSAGFFFIFFSSRVVKKMKAAIPIAIQEIESIEEKNRKEKEETERLRQEVQVVDNLKNTLYFSRYKEESLESFSLDVHFEIGSYRDETIEFTPYYDCVHFEDQYLFCMGKITEHNIYSMASILMIQTALNNSFSENLEKKVNLIELLDRINSVLFFNNQYRMKLGSFSTFSLAHYDLKKEQIHLVSLNQEIIFIPKDSEGKDWIKCEFPIEMKRYYLGMFGIIPEIEQFCFHTFSFSKGDSVLICDYLDDYADFFQHMSKEKNLFQKEDSKKVVHSLLEQKLFKPSFLSCIKKV